MALTMERRNYKGTRKEARALTAYVKLMRASEAVTVRIHRPVVDAGLTVTQFGVLEALYSLGPLSQRDIARKILKSTGNITFVIDKLEQRGLVRRERNRKDRRLYAVDLTQAGRRMIRSMFPRHAARVVREMKSLTVSEQEELSRLCRKVGLGGEGKKGNKTQ